jgi:hypothetical protein
MPWTGAFFAALGLASALGGCNPPGYGACYAVCNPAPYASAYPTAYAGPGFAFATPFDDPFLPYSQRILTVTPTAGNAQAANLALQTATPWPRHAYNTNIPGNGAQMVRAVHQFERGTGPALGTTGAAGAAAPGGGGGSSSGGSAGGSTSSMGASGGY